MASRPNFFIIGAQKSGSSWLSAVLRQHREIFVAPTEVHYFDKLHNQKKGMDWYLSHFSSAGSCRAIGEKTPEYLWANGNGAEGHNPNVHKDLIGAFPNAKYLVVLRNPVNRAVSALIHMIKSNRLPFTWPIDKLFNERHRTLLEPWGILEKGLYARQIRAYLDLIPKDQMKILIFEQDVLNCQEESAKAVCKHLEVDPSFAFEDLATKRNSSPLTRRTLLRATSGKRWPSLSLILPDKPISIARNTRLQLSDFYREENQRLFEILGRSIPEWEYR